MIETSGFHKSKDELEREQIMRETFELAASKLDGLENINATYRYAMRKASKIIREMKP